MTPPNGNEMEMTLSLDSAGFREPIEMPVSERYLLEGAWYALEQCGRLLHDAITLYEAGRYATASGIAMLAREELGRARILLALAEEVHAGRPLTLVELEGAIADHV